MAISQLVKPASATEPSWTLLASTPISSAVSGVSLNSPTFANYRTLRIFVDYVQITGGTGYPYIAINSDTSSKYSSTGLTFYTTSSTYAQTDVVALEYLWLIAKTGAGNLLPQQSSTSMSAVIEITNANTTEHKHYKVSSSYLYASNYQVAKNCEGIYVATTGAAITSIFFGTTNGSFLGNGYGGFRIYGAN
jgi:hypothetical protein